MNVKSCTDIEQSKKFIELGISPKTADWVWLAWLNFDGEPGGHYDLEALEDSSELEEEENESKIPAWSLSAMIKIIPIVTCGKYHDFPQLRHYNGFFYDSYAYTTKSYENPIDAAYDMICWLKKNGKL